jgi:hypothetical protein
MTNNPSQKYEIYRKSGSDFPAAVKPFLVKYPPLGAVRRESEGSVRNYYWNTGNGQATLSLSEDGGAVLKFVLDDSDDSEERSLMMKLVSVGYNSRDVQIRRAIASILSEMLDA